MPKSALLVHILCPRWSMPEWTGQRDPSSKLLWCCRGLLFCFPGSVLDGPSQWAVGRERTEPTGAQVSHRHFRMSADMGLGGNPPYLCWLALCVPDGPGQKGMAEERSHPKLDIPRAYSIVHIFILLVKNTLVS